MGIVIRQSLKASFVSYIGIFIGAFSTLWLYPKLLKPEEIGLLNLIQGIAFISAGFLQLGASNVIDKFFPQFKNFEQKHQGFLSFMLFYTATGFLLFSIIYSLSTNYWLEWYREKSPEVANYIIYILLFALFIAYQAVLEAYSRAHLRIALPSVFKDIFTRLGVIFLVLFYFFGYFSFFWVIVGYVMVCGVAVLLLIVYLYRLKVFFLVPISKQYLQKNTWQPMLTFAFYIFLGGMSASFTSRIDNLMIGAYLGTAWVGIYSVALYMATVIEIPQRALAQISTPIIAEAWKNNDLKAIQQIYQKSATNQLLLGCYIFLGIWLNIDYVFQLMPNGTIYEAGKYVMLWLGLAKVIDMATGLNGVIILQSNYYKFNLFLAIFLAFLLWFSNLFFIAWYGIVGVAWATFLSMLIWNVIKFLFLKLKFNLQPFDLKTLQAIALVGVVYLIVIMIPKTENAILNIMAQSVGISVLMGIGILVFKISPEAQQLWILGRNRLKNFISREKK
ncbi:MAG: hypothetical protein EAZ55_10255 [Cytophagales bacterium]|nr:MAG: hypothetical protein EAZ55_10255 [Cytophagales bacterium]